MTDPTEDFRRKLVTIVNSQVESGDSNNERIRLETKYGKVWDTDELTSEFDVHGFAAPFVIVTRKSNNKRGSMCFQDWPRFYFKFLVKGE